MIAGEEPITLILASAASELHRTECGGLALSERRRRACREQHMVMLCMSVLILVLASLMQVTMDEAVVLSSWPDRPLPPGCLFRSLFASPCPGCGLTRSFVHLMHGDIQAAWQMHRLGWLLLCAVIAQIPYRSAALLFPDRQVLGNVIPRAFGYLLIALLILNWIALLFADATT